MYNFRDIISTADFIQCDATNKYCMQLYSHNDRYLHSRKSILYISFLFTCEKQQTVRGAGSSTQWFCVFGPLIGLIISNGL